MKNKILIVGGEPNSINTEILFKCWKKLSPNLKSKIYLIANFKLIKEHSKFSVIFITDALLPTSPQ